MPLTFAYGPAPSQTADLHLPGARPTAVVVLFHGGFWRFPYGRDQLDDLAADLVQRGYAVWNVGYRRVGEPGGGWPGTVADAFAALDFLADPALASHGLDLAKVVAAGHSAGGHLALLTALAERPAPFAPRQPRVRPRAVASLAGIPDLARVHALGSGHGAVAALLGGDPDGLPERVRSISPLAHLPLGVPQLVLHGTGDTALPVALARDYAEGARQAGDAVTFLELGGAGHMDFLDPASPAHGALCAWLEAVLQTPSSG